ncbi:MAG TPA: beta-galactosidase, partial [Solirubrobacteraceae bacterium]
MRFLLSGEFHYFRVPRVDWTARLDQVRAAGLNTVSIYVPWNWHQTDPDTAPDFGGTDVPERDLVAALEEIAAAGLDCIFRPGPFITAEWRGGGIPDWLWQQAPEMLALNAAGQATGLGRPYPVITYSHPAYESAACAWLEATLDVSAPFLASHGGPIVNLQLDDEPSYFNQIDDPLAVDYNPFLVDPGEDGSRYARWLLQRHSSLEAINAAHTTQAARLRDVVPPREPLGSPAEFVRHRDWLDFKLACIDAHVAVLYDLVRERSYDAPMSMLFPYLTPLQAAKFSAFAQQRGMDLQLTNECYLSLFSSTRATEEKVGNVLATHETYHMWRGADQGPGVTMELQGSNSTYITPGAMELLYALTVARGIRGVNLFMMVGGRNPPGFENATGAEYDICAPIGLDGSERPHYAVIKKLSRVVRAVEDEILSAEPLRDTWLGCYVPYEDAALVGGDAMFDARAVHKLFSSGDMGLSDAPSLAALMALASVSFGCLDLERASDAELVAARQLWVPGLEFMSAQVQRRLANYALSGGRLVLMPGVPHLNEAMVPCATLLELAFAGATPPNFTYLAPGPSIYTGIRGVGGESIVAPGPAARFADLPGDATALAWTTDGDVPCAFTRPVGSGTVTVVGFRLQYMATASPRQKNFVVGLVETGGPALHAQTRSTDAAAFELAGPDGGLLCVVNPAGLPVSTTVTYSPPGTNERTGLPLSGELRLAGQGARLLPIGIGLGNGAVLRHATWELIGRETLPGGETELRFATAPGERGEIALEGRPDSQPLFRGGALES